MFAIRVKDPPKEEPDRPALVSKITRLGDLIEVKFVRDPKTALTFTDEDRARQEIHRFDLPRTRYEVVPMMMDRPGEAPMPPQEPPPRLSPVL